MGSSADLSGLGTTPRLDRTCVEFHDPSGYLTKLLSEVSDGHYPTRKQLHVLAVFVEHLDIVKQQEDEGVPWDLRAQLVILLLGQGGCGKTWLVQQFIAKVVAYAFCVDTTIRMIALSNPSARNLSSDRFPAHTIHQACSMMGPEAH